MFANIVQIQLKREEEEEGLSFGAVQNVHVRRLQLRRALYSARLNPRTPDFWVVKVVCFTELPKGDITRVC